MTGPHPPWVAAGAEIYGPDGIGCVEVRASAAFSYWQSGAPTAGQKSRFSERDARVCCLAERFLFS
ncbi:MAG TPA: hypothetical protein VFU02_00295 [Polyangiaceae bacterium]|nr:hypothetical protein [Polyangiaceae bacterium]